MGSRTRSTALFGVLRFSKNTFLCVVIGAVHPNPSVSHTVCACVFSAGIASKALDGVPNLTPC